MTSLKNSVQDQIEQQHRNYNKGHIHIEVDAGKGKSDDPKDGTGKETRQKGEKETKAKMVSALPPAGVRVNDGEDVEVVEGLDEG